jgi:arsenate reductase
MISVLFVYVHNTGRSQMAEALADVLSGGALRAASAGTSPGDTLNPMVVRAMAERGIDISGKRPRVVYPGDGRRRRPRLHHGLRHRRVLSRGVHPIRGLGIGRPSGPAIDGVRTIRNQIEQGMAVTERPRRDGAT